MNVLKSGLMPGATIDGMAVARLFEASNAMIAAAYIGQSAKNSREALAALPAMVEMLELAGPALSSIAAKLRNMTAPPPTPPPWNLAG